MLRRAQAVARIRHPNLARLLPLPGGAGLQPILGDARKLADFTLPAGTFKRFDLEQVVRLLLDVLAGLGALHEVVTDGQAFVHGEVCPSNVYVDEHGTARLVPLLNGHSGPVAPQHTGYAAPERLLGSVPDARVDTFSVGVMLWEALAGMRLFPDPSPTAVLARKVPPIQLDARTAWARPLCAIAERAIAFDPRARFQTVDELAKAMDRAVSSHLSGMVPRAWQEEAPTPVFQPRLHLAGLRASAVLPVVETSARSNQEVSHTVSPIVSDEPELEKALPPRRVGRAAFAVATLMLGALGLGWQVSRSGYVPAPPVERPRATPVSAAASPNDVAMPLATAPSSASASAAALPAPVTSASASPVSAHPQKAPRPAALPARQKPPPSKMADYGI
jgi:serine/threonine protein kinase